jgi:hypothetical protein
MHREVYIRAHLPPLSSLIVTRLAYIYRRLVPVKLHKGLGAI